MGKGGGHDDDDDESCEVCDALKIMKDARGMLKGPSKPATATPGTPTTTPPASITETNTSSYKIEAPPDLTEIGRSTWTLLHTIAAYYPENPSEKKKEQVGKFIQDLSEVFPCRTCAEDFQEHISTTPINIKSRNDLSLWMCEAHNHVNERLGKPAFDCSLVDQRWRYAFSNSKR